MNAQIDINEKDNMITIKTTLHDSHALQDGNEVTAEGMLDITIEISPQGVNIFPANETDQYIGDGIFKRETFIEFYLSQMVTHVWNGTQEDPVTSIIQI